MPLNIQCKNSSRKRSALRPVAAGVALLACLLIPSRSFAATDIAVPERARAGHGWSYQHDEVPGIPWSIHIVKVDRSRSELELHTLLARGNGFGLTKITEQIQLLPPELGRPVALVRREFFPDALLLFELVHGESDPLVADELQRWRALLGPGGGASPGSAEASFGSATGPTGGGEDDGPLRRRRRRRGGRSRSGS